MYIIFFLLWLLKCACDQTFANRSPLIAALKWTHLIYSTQGLLCFVAGTCKQHPTKWGVLYLHLHDIEYECVHHMQCTYIWFPRYSRFATTPPPPPPPRVWSQHLRFAAFCMKTRYLQCFLHGGWLARSANLQMRRISCNQPSENVLFAMFRLRPRGVVPLHPPLCEIII